MGWAKEQVERGTEKVVYNIRRSRWLSVRETKKLMQQDFDGWGK